MELTRKAKLERLEERLLWTSLGVVETGIVSAIILTFKSYERHPNYPIYALMAGFGGGALCSAVGAVANKYRRRLPQQ